MESNTGIGSVTGRSEIINTSLPHEKKLVLGLVLLALIMMAIFYMGILFQRLQYSGT